MTVNWVMIEGQVLPCECDLLFRLASQVSRGCIVEVGSFRGRSTAALAFGSKAGCGKPVYAVDPHVSFEGFWDGGKKSFRYGPEDGVAFLSNILKLGLADVVKPVFLPSKVVSKGWLEPVELLWIDGAHKYDAVRDDFECWQPHVVQGGLIALHDSAPPFCTGNGPWRVVQEALETGRFRTLETVHITTVLRKIC